MGPSIIRTGRWSSGQILVLETLERSTQPTCTHRLAQVLARWLVLLFEELPPSSWMPFAFLLNVTFPLMSTGEKTCHSVWDGFLKESIILSLPLANYYPLGQMWVLSLVLLAAFSLLGARNTRNAGLCSVSLFLFFSNYRATLMKRATQELCYIRECLKCHKPGCTPGKGTFTLHEWENRTAQLTTLPLIPLLSSTVLVPRGWPVTAKPLLDLLLLYRNLY